MPRPAATITALRIFTDLYQLLGFDRVLERIVGAPVNLEAAGLAASATIRTVPAARAVTSSEIARMPRCVSIAMTIERISEFY